MTPIIALVGRPNVGKSTLFNWLTGTRDAIVSDFAGLTRDRQYGRASLRGRPFIITDTSGIEGKETGIEAMALKQTDIAMTEADIIVFLVDAKTGATAADLTLAYRIRLLEKPVIVLANKTDKVNEEVALADFHQLGLGEPLGISAAHRRGLGKFSNQLFEKLGLTAENEDSLVEEKEDTQKNIIKIAIIGKPNVGKSTLVNYLLGEERVLVYDMPGTTRDSIHIPLNYRGQDYLLIDTAGIRRKSRTHETIEKFSIIKSLQAIDEANVAVLVIDAKENITDQDLHLLSYILTAGRSLIIAINKWDCLDNDAKKNVKASLDRKLTFVNFATIHYISALKGSGVNQLLTTVNSVYESATKKHSTNLLTKILLEATENHAPPTVNGRRIKLKYAHSGGHNPPVIVIHGSQAALLSKDYQRYLTHFFREALKLTGTPIHLELKTTENPFKDKPNLLTPSQARQRQRVISHAKIQKKKRQQKRTS